MFFYYLHAAVEAIQISYTRTVVGYRDIKKSLSEQIDCKNLEFFEMFTGAHDA